jgi:hypothetical protein
MSMQTDAEDQQFSGDSQQSRKKSRRAGQACDRCRSRKIKVQTDPRSPGTAARPFLASIVLQMLIRIISVTANCPLAVLVRAQRSSARRQTEQAIAQSQEGTSYPRLVDGINADNRYLETLEFKVTEQERLQNRILELEARLRDLDPSINSRSGSAQQFLTPPETSTLQSAQQGYLTPAIESNRSHSPHDQSYPDDRLSDIRTKGSMVASAGADQDANTDPGVFEADEAGKGWYLGCASGSKPSMSSIADHLVIYMNSIKNTASSGNFFTFTFLF